MKSILTAAMLATITPVLAESATQPSDTNAFFLVETAVLQTTKPLTEAAQWEGRYSTYFETYDVPASTNLYQAYAEVLYQYARILKHEDKYEQAVQMIDEKKRIQLRGYIQHMMQSCKAELLTAWAESETDPRRTELLNEAKRTLETMQW